MAKFQSTYRIMYSVEFEAGNQSAAEQIAKVLEKQAFQFDKDFKYVELVEVKQKTN